ncbi:aminopeptidase [Microlunatus endophyticus]|uniref:Aminopeptidase N n=1 Tax=Microlunatus endophyticus TaxID=1716077 RepID=A0A917RZQ4_9ACTN|nr:aminopeptidase N [Microlunatus endophyticus]GGL47382.1 aminopeptidase [Microlunatus endophyticus]
MPSLTRLEAQQRAATITVRDTRVALDLSSQDGQGASEFGSVTTIGFEARPGSDTFLDFKGVRLNSATLNGSELDPESWQDERIPLTDLQASNTVTVDGVMAYSSDGEGLHRHVDPADGNLYLYAMSFLDAGPRWFACFDQPDLKSRYTFQVSAPDDWTVHGNGPAEKGPSTVSGIGTWTITPPQPLSTYFVTLIAGRYASLYSEHDGIPLGIHVRASLGNALRREAENIFEVTGQAFDYYHRTFGVRYPFGEYHQAFVPDFNAGAMENPGCVTFRDSFIYRSRATRSERAGRAGVIAHEMAHQWFGDLVTMRWWDDLWLNESFAEYMAHRCCTEATEYPLWTEFGISRKAWGYVVDQSAATHPIAGNGAEDAQSSLQNFDGISYAKGAATLRQLAGYLGDDVFLAGLRRHFDQYGYANADFSELVASWTAAGGTGLDDWTRQWLLTAGVDTLAVTDGSLVRTPPADRPADRSHAVHLAGISSTGELLGVAPVVVASDPIAYDRPDGAIAVVPDAYDQTWAKLRFDAADWRQLRSVVSRIDEPGSRVAIWNSVRDQVRDAELDPREALAMITDQLADEPDDVVVNIMLQTARRSLAGPYTPIAERVDRLAEVAALADRILAAAEPGSDRQLMAFRNAVPACSDVDRLDAWRLGLDLPSGIELDPDLTWAIVTRLCTLADRPETIDQTLAADRSAAAEVNAARARAALPTAEAKQQAYDLLMKPSEASAYVLYATAEALFGDSAEQVQLTKPYALSFFTDIAATAGFRTGWALGRIPSLGFPLSVTEPEVLTAAEAVLDDDNTSPVIRRVVLEDLDQLRRALASLDRFTGQ